MAITAGFLVAHSVVQVGIYGFGAEKHWLDSLNMDRELNLPTLFSSALLLMAALLMQRLGQSSDRIAPRTGVCCRRFSSFWHSTKPFRSTRS